MVSNILWEIKYWFKYNYVPIFIVIGLSIATYFGAWTINQIPRDVLFPLGVEQIIDIAEGQLISIRATGSWNIYDTELKFEDGTMILVTYNFSRSNNLKAGHRYKIWNSSYYGKRCKLLEELNN